MPNVMWRVMSAPRRPTTAVTMRLTRPRPTAVRSACAKVASIMTRERVADPPSPFAGAWIVRLRPRAGAVASALDVAMGRGRHAALLAAAGYDTFGVDLNMEALRGARTEIPRLHAWCADLTSCPLPRARF